MAKIHGKIAMPAILADVGGQFHDFVYSQLIRGYKIDYSNDQLIMLGLNPGNQPSFQNLATVVQNGGSFSGIKLGLQFTALAADRDVPVGVPGSTITPEGEATRQKTWLEWIRGNAQAIYQRVIGTPVYYVMKSALGEQLLTSEELVAAIATSGVSVIEFSDFKSRIQSDNYEKFDV